MPIRQYPVATRRREWQHDVLDSGQYADLTASGSAHLNWRSAGGVALARNRGLTMQMTTTSLASVARCRLLVLHRQKDGADPASCSRKDVCRADGDVINSPTLPSDKPRAAVVGALRSQRKQQGSICR
jgi:hypothetical protein